MTIEDIALALGLIALPLIGSFLGALLAHWLDKNRETHRIFLEELHGRRADAIAKLYALLARTERAAGNLVKPYELPGEPSENEKRQELNDSWREFRNHFQSNKIFLAKEDVQVVDQLLKLIADAMWDFGSPIRQAANARPERADLVLRSTELGEKAWDTVSVQIPIVRAQLENRLRQQLDPS